MNLIAPAHVGKSAVTGQHLALGHRNGGKFAYIFPMQGRQFQLVKLPLQGQTLCLLWLLLHQSLADVGGVKWHVQRV